MRRQTRQGFARGELDIRGTGPDVGVSFRLAFQNENLLFWRDDQPQATVPDLITVVDEQSGRPVTTEGLQYGLRVAVLGFPSHAQWQTPAGLALVGPRAFGYEIDYVPLHAST